MDRAEDFQIPSPKRARVEAQELEISEKLATIDKNDAPIMPTANPVKSPQSKAPILEKASPPTIQRYSQLPGLGLVYEDQQLPNEEGLPMGVDSEKQGPSQNTSTIKTIFGHVDAEQMQASRGDTPIVIGEKDDILCRKSSISKIDASTEANRRINGHCAEDAHLEDLATENSMPMQIDDITLDSKLQQANIGSPSPGKVSGTHAAVDSRLIRAGFSTAEEAQEEVSQDQDTAPNGEIGEKDLSMESSAAIENTEPVAKLQPTFEELAEANKSNADAEFELDSSPLGSSSSEISSDTSSSAESDADNDADDYEMLSPEEQARRLMAEDGGSDDGRPAQGAKGDSGVLRTLNEKPDEIVPKPDVTVNPDMRIEELGRVENLVENVVLIKANTTGEYQVLETGTVLCVEDRSVIGVIAETLGRVQQPYYSVRFTNAAAISDAGIVQGIRIFYVEKFSTTVFTEPLKAFKGSDASNLHDEEVGEDELEFSDDEAEAEHKRQVKLQKRRRHGGRESHLDGFARGPPQKHGERNEGPDYGLRNWPENPPESMGFGLNYDDADGANENNEDEDDLYTPLARPSNFHEIMSQKPPSTESQTSRGHARRVGRGGGRGSRQRVRGGRGADGRSQFDQKGQANSHEDRHSHAGPHSYSTPQTNGFGFPSNSTVPARVSHHSHVYGPPSNERKGQETHQAPIPPNYPPQSQARSYPNLPSPDLDNYTQFYSQPQQNHIYPSQYPQQQNSFQYYQPQHSSPQTYRTRSSFPSTSQYPSQQPSTIPPSTSNIPPGAHINPAFFHQQVRSQQQAWQQPDSEATRRVQESLSLLKGLGRGGRNTPT